MALDFYQLVNQILKESIEDNVEFISYEEITDRLRGVYDKKRGFAFKNLESWRIKMYLISRKNKIDYKVTFEEDGIRFGQLIEPGLTFIEFFRRWNKSWTSPSPLKYVEAMLAASMNELLWASHSVKCKDSPHGCVICLIRSALNDYHKYTFDFKNYVKSIKDKS